MQKINILVVWRVKGHPRSPAVSSFNRAYMTSNSSLIETMHLSCTVFELQWVICQKSSILTYYTRIWLWHPHLGDPVRISLDLWHQETRVPGLSCGVVCVILHLATLTQYRCVTDTQTHDDGIYHASIASHGTSLNTYKLSSW